MLSWRSALVVLAALSAACASTEEADPSTTAAVAPAPPTSVAPTTATPITTTTTTVPATTAPVTTAPPTAAPTVPPTTGVAPQDFTLVSGRITAPDGSTCDVCLWLAADPVARARGLMGVTDLSGADGMLFAWDEATTGSFWMRGTPQPLSIAFFAADGSFVSAADMAPCLAPTPDADCARYAAAGPYVHAIEVAQDGLRDLLIGPGSRLDVTGEPCPLDG